MLVLSIFSSREILATTERSISVRMSSVSILFQNHPQCSMKRKFHELTSEIFSSCYPEDDSEINGYIAGDLQSKLEKK